MNLEPIFKSIFVSWESLPAVFKKHYANRAFSNDLVVVEGRMKVESSTFARILNPLLKFTGALVPYEGDDVPVTVRFKSEPDSNAYCFNREFRFQNKPIYQFNSRMLPIKGGEVIEFMKFGIGWRAEYKLDGQKITLNHKGYVLRLFGCDIPIPLGIIFGKGYAEEKAISDDEFEMMMEIRHFLWGRIYSYSGKFIVKEISLNA